MEKDTVILHSDLNCYYASVEMNEHPELKGKKMAASCRVIFFTVFMASSLLSRRYIGSVFGE